MTTAQRIPILGAALLLAATLPVHAGWWEVVQADAALDLPEARERALDTVADDPRSADAVATAGWWASNLGHLAEPEALLATANDGADPALAFMLARIEAELARRAPAGVLTSVELAGPFGVFDVLDIDRGVVPPDGQLPPLGTRWRCSWQPFNLAMEFVDGWVRPPEPMVVSGVFLAAWTLNLEREADGWLVLEVDGSFNLEIDGEPVDSKRHCGEDSPAVSWYRVQLEPGQHRLRLAFASRGTPRARVALLGREGSPLEGVEPGTGGDGEWANASVHEALPPAEEALLAGLDGEAVPLGRLLLAAEMARLRGDADGERGWLERAAERFPGDPWPHFGLARFFVTRYTGSAPQNDFQRASDHLRQCTELPARLLLERFLAVTENRSEDAERLLDELVEAHGDDPRVLEIWIHDAVQRGWAREAEESFTRLQGLLSGSPGVADLRLEVLAGLERWQEHRALLEALAETHQDTLTRVEELSKRRHQDEAVAMLDRIRSGGDSPDLALGAVTMRAEAGRFDEARTELERAVGLWGDLPAFDNLRLVLAWGDEEAIDAALERALARRPWNLELRTLAWRRGAPRFYEPFRVDALALAEEQERGMDASEVDAMLLLDQAVERIFDDGSSIYYYHGLTKVLNSTGVRQASTLQHLPGTLHLNVRIIKPDGRIVVPPELSPGADVIEINDLEAGDLLEEEYVASLEPTGASRRGHLSPYTYRFADPERAFGLSEYALVVPPGVELKIDGNFEGLEKSEWEQDGLRVIRWRVEQVPPVQREPFSPPVQDLLPWVTYGFGVSWQDVGDAIRDRVLAVLRGSRELDAFSEPLLAADDAVEAVGALMDGVVDEVEAGRGSLELGTPAGVSFARKEGNRLAILATALVHGGWQVDLVLARPFALSRAHLEVPNPDIFYEPLLRVRRGDETVWIDVEENRGGVDHISPVLQRSDALVVPLADPMQPVSYLESLPEFDNPDLEDLQYLQAEISEAGDARLVYDLPLRSARAERMLRQVRSIPADRVQQVFHQLASNLFPGAAAVTGDVSRQDSGAVLHLEMELAGACEVERDSMTCRNLVIANPLSGALASLSERTFPLVLQLPVEQRQVVTLKPPAGWVVDRPARRVQARWGEIGETLEQEGGTFRSELRLRIPAVVVAPDEYPAFARFCHAVDELTSRPPTLARTGG